jgi:urease accessory protein
MSGRRKYPLLIARWGVVGAVLAPRAEAHLVTTGLGPVYDGIGHFFLSPEDAIPVVALALLAGLRGAEAGRRALLALPVAWIAGGIIGAATGGAELSGQIAAALSFLLLGVLVALDRALATRVVAALALLLGGVHGFFNGRAMGVAGAGPAVLQLVGVGAVLFVLVALVAAFVVSLRRPWTRLVVRVAGSWIAAMGLLLLGWTLRPKR